MTNFDIRSDSSGHAQCGWLVVDTIVAFAVPASLLFISFTHSEGRLHARNVASSGSTPLLASVERNLSHTDVSNKP